MLSQTRYAAILLTAVIAGCNLITEQDIRKNEDNPQNTRQAQQEEHTVESPVTVVPIEPPRVTESDVPSIEAEETETPLSESIEKATAAEPAEPAEPASYVSEEMESASEVLKSEPKEPEIDLAEMLCQEIGDKLGSVDYEDCTSQKLIHADYSIQGKSLAYKDFEPISERAPLGRVLVIGGIHGDEFSSVSVVFKWMEILQEHHSGLFHWRFIPSANPDGLLQKKSQRQNSAGVDLNRNFPTQDWDESAIEYWKERAYSNARRYPGEQANSEPETQFLVNQIDEFNPDVIISMHAPYHLVDYDGPPSAPKKLGGLYLRQLGVYPGSLGNYVGVDKKKPIVTVELKSAGIMPSNGEIDRMWTDLVRWLRNQLG